MPTAPQCLQCAEAEDLAGVPRGADIELTCQTCGTTWMRGPARCRGCGGTHAVTRTQLMTRHPRGTLLAVVGRRRITLCPRCDAEMLARLGGEATETPVPEGYVSRFYAGLTQPSPPASQAPRPRRRPSRASGPPPTAPTPPRPTPDRPRLEAPTVRQAIEHYLEAHPDADSLAMVMLGQHLGPSTRLHRLTGDVTSELTAWLARTWPDDRRREAPAASVEGALAHWRHQGWLEDL